MIVELIPEAVCSAKFLRFGHVRAVFYLREHPESFVDYVRGPLSCYLAEK